MWISVKRSQQAEWKKKFQKKKVVLSYKVTSSTLGLLQFTETQPVKIPPEVQWWRFQEVTKEPNNNGRNCRSSDNVGVYDSTIRKILSSYGRAARQKPPLTKWNINSSTAKNLDYLKTCFSMDGLIFVFFDMGPLTFSLQLAHYSKIKNNTPIVRHGGGIVMVWGSFAASETFHY